MIITGGKIQFEYFLLETKDTGKLGEKRGRKNVQLSRAGPVGKAICKVDPSYPIGGKRKQKGKIRKYKDNFKVKHT